MDSSQKPETFLLTAEAEASLPHQAQIALQQVDNLKYFLISAPVDWTPDQFIRRFLLPTGDYVSCVLWNNLFHISGTDIVRCLAFRFQAFGRPVKNAKKFEEGIFSDLRNLKAGNDASLEEPKSPFLDFLYKNNCIRTQKKQKVFYWYSVPHDRLFLDALERDLKRENAGQETTTNAESEPALSFDYDSSQSLFEQLTKSTQSRNSSDNANDDEISQSISPPTVGAVESVAHQQTVSHAMHHVAGSALNDQLTYSHTMPPQVASTIAMPMNHMMTGQMNNGGYYNPAAYGPVSQNNISYNLASAPAESSHQRQGSVPVYYMESSPAPSFISSQSHHEDYSRAVSYEPVTPPQHGYNYTQEPSYTPSEEHTYFAPKVDQYPSYNGVMQFPPPTMPQHRHSSVPRQYPSNVPYAHIEGSPLYKQRRRNSSLTYGQSAVGSMQPPAQTKPAYAAHRPSDLRRSVSASVVPQTEDHMQRAMSGPPGSFGYMNELRRTPSVSRQSSPMNEDQRSLSVNKRRYSSLMADELPSTGPGVLKRARSATASEADPSPPKNHHCPIPACGRAFGRLEHLKRHVRTHTQERPYQCALCEKSFSRSDNLAQHKRTHEPNSDGIVPVDFSEEDFMGEDQATPFTGDISQSSMDSYMQGSQASAGASDSFGMQNVYTVSQSQDSFSSDMSHEYSATASSMGPPPLPSHISGY